MKLGEVAFQIDLAAAAIAVVALLFSIWSYRTPADAAVRSQMREDSTTHKRHFISEVQSAVDPCRRISFLEQQG